MTTQLLQLSQPVADQFLVWTNCTLQVAGPAQKEYLLHVRHWWIVSPDLFFFAGIPPFLIGFFVGLKSTKTKKQNEN